jgi:hypothetical protein
MKQGVSRIGGKGMGELDACERKHQKHRRPKWPSAWMAILICEKGGGCSANWYATSLKCNPLNLWVLPARGYGVW